MKYIFTLLDTENNKLIECSDNFEWCNEEWCNEEELMLFQWTQNNFSCDCNRRDVMYGSSDSHKCGCEVKLLKITDTNGKLIYEEVTK